MQLRIQRAQKEGGVFSKNIYFCLTAMAELTPDEAENVRRYKLGKNVVYNSEASQQYLAKADTALAEGSAKGLMRGMIAAAMSRTKLNITVASLCGGHYIECKDLEELLGAEEAIMQSCKVLRAYLDTAATFDGREMLIEFPAGGEPRESPPAHVVAQITIEGAAAAE